MSTLVDLKNKYTDIDLSLRINPITGDIIKLRNSNAIKSSLIHILMSSEFDIHNEPRITDLKDYTFENLNNVIIAEIKESLKFNINKYEKRIDLIEIRVDGDHQTQSLLIYLKFLIKDLDEVDDMTYAVKRKV